MPTHTARSRSGGAETWRAGPCRGSTGRSPAAPLAGSLSCRRALVKARPTEACGKVGPGCRPVSAARPRYISRWRQQNGATLLACRRACASRAAATRGREGFSGDGVESHTRTHTRTHTHTHTHAHTGRTTSSDSSMIKRKALVACSAMQSTKHQSLLKICRYQVIFIPEMSMYVRR